jgi:RNA polymerase sigma-70 factor (ECF subfamily)
MATSDNDDFLTRFHAGDRDALAEAYRDHFQTVYGVAGRIVRGPDQETVVHDVFLALLTKREVRENFQGGSLSAWLTTVTRNKALDLARQQRRQREQLEAEAATQQPPGSESATDDQIDARRLVEEFEKNHLPEKWSGVFQLRFLRQLTQREAAAELGIGRTTLIYQEHRVRQLLKRFLLEGAK